MAITATELRELIGQVEAAGLGGGVVMMPRPPAPYRPECIRVAHRVYGREIGANRNELFVFIPLDGLRRALALAELLQAPPQGEV